MSEYLSVKEFAAAARVSQQYIYKIKGSSLKPYVKKENKKTMIHKDGLKIILPDSTDSTFGEQPISTSKEADLQPKVEFVEQTDSTKNSTAEAAEIAALHLLVEELKKDKEYLRQQLDSKDKLIDTLTSRVESDAIRLDKMQLLLDQQQKLSLVDKTGMTKEDIITSSQEESIEEPIAQKKKGFFNRFFNK